MSLLIPVTEEKNALGLNKEPISKLYGAKFINIAKASGSKCVIIMSGKKKDEERIVSETYAQVNALLSSATEDYSMKVSVLSVSGNTRDNYPYDLSIRTSQIVEVYADSNASNSVIRVRNNENKEDMYYTVSGDLDDIKSKVPRKYEVLLSQNAPVASTNTPSMLAGQIWTLEVMDSPGDDEVIDTLELVSGTLYAVGSKYRVSVDTNVVFNDVNSEMSYDGAPYIVSTDVNGDFNPTVNTTGTSATFAYGNANKQYLYLTGLVLMNKTLLKIGQNDVSGTNLNNIYNDGDNDTIVIKTTEANALYYTSVEIKINP